MKLRNKCTGEIATLTLCSNGEDLLIMRDGRPIIHDVKLSDLREWEDYEEPKECDYYTIEPDGSIFKSHKPKFINNLLEPMKSIGNYFETKEEAERALEKLKAWKRLKDKGVYFERSHLMPSGQPILKIKSEYQATLDEIDEAWKDLELLFGGK